MAGPTVTVKGYKEAQQAFRKLGGPELRKQLRDTNKAFAQKIVDLALPNVPVRSGRLKASVKASGTEKGAVGRAGSPSRVPYAAAIHWGWPRRGIRAQPFLSDAAARLEDQVVEEYGDDLQRLINRIVR